LSLTSRNALVQYPGYHLVCRGEIPVKGKGNMRTYFLCGKEGFKKDLPNCDENVESGQGGNRVSLTSLNSMASLVSSPSTCYSFVSSNCAPTPKTSQISNISNFSRSVSIHNSSNDSLEEKDETIVTENSQGSEVDEKFKLKETGLLESTCL
jgi:hypothetical protein